MNSCFPRVRSVIAIASITGFSLAAQAQVEEDSSAAFERANAELGAAMGLPAADLTVRTHDNGMISAQMGLEAMKMLIVRQNPDGSLSYGHAATDSEAAEFLRSDSVTGREAH